MLGILAWIIMGLIAGLLAKAIMPGKDPGGAIVTTLLGIVGAVIGGFIGRGLGNGRAIDSAGQLSEPGFLVSMVLAIIGAIIVLSIYRLTTGRSLRS